MRFPSALVLVVSGSLAVTAGAQTTTRQAYTLSVEATDSGQKFLATIYRDGPKERVEIAGEGLPGNMFTLYDFEAHKVYWVVTGPKPSCSAGHYRSAHAPISVDPVTDPAQASANVLKGAQRKFVRREEVNGIPARVEDIAVPAKAAASGEVQPTRVWLSEPDGLIVKMEGASRGGRPSTILEAKQFTKEKPQAALFSTPADCTMTDAEMDDTGVMRASGQMDVSAKASGEVNLADRTGQSAVAVSSTRGKTPAQSAEVAVTAVALQVSELPGAPPCRRKLTAKGAVSVNGPATVWYRFYSDVGGLQFAFGPQGTTRLAAAGSVNVTKDVAFAASKAGELRLEAAVQGPDGRHDAVTISNVVTFRVVCGTVPPGR